MGTLWLRLLGCDVMQITLNRHCEERSDEAIQFFVRGPLDCFASLAMTAVGVAR